MKTYFMTKLVVMLSCIFMLIDKTSPAHSKSALNTLTYHVRREPYYHKLQYSKVPKFDVAAALFGVIISAFVGYLTLSTLGSAGADLSDMLILFWYSFVLQRIVLLTLFVGRSSIVFFVITDFVTLIFNIDCIKLSSNVLASQLAQT